MNKSMKKLRLFAVVALVGIAYFASTPAHARDPKQAALFKRTHLCPSTHKTTGPCTGYVINHIKPLCAGGLDSPVNMAWQEYKASLASDIKERALCRALKAKKI